MQVRSLRTPQIHLIFMNASAVIKYMENGWELIGDVPEMAARLPEPRNIWLQEGGLGTPGKWLNVPVGTMEALELKKRVEEAPRRPNQPAWMSIWRARKVEAKGRNVAQR